MEAHLGGRVLQGARLEVASPHPVLDGAKDLLDYASAYTHGTGHAVETGLHGLDHRFVFSPLDAALEAVCPIVVRIGTYADVGNNND